MIGQGEIHASCSMKVFFTLLDSIEFGSSCSTVIVLPLSFREPLIVDPQHHITSHDRMLVQTQFNDCRGPEYSKGPAMYIISPADYDGVQDMAGSKVVGGGDNNDGGVFSQTQAASAAEKVWAPTITSEFPEKVVLFRAAALAKCSHDHLITCLMRGFGGKVSKNSWVAAFQESSASLTSYSALMRITSSCITDAGCSSTNADFAIGAPQSKLPAGNDVSQSMCSPFEKSLQNIHAGPKELRKKHYKNFVLEKDLLVSSRDA